MDDHHCNTLGSREETRTVTLGADILGPDAKRAHREQLTEERGVQIRAALTTGDGANDIPMLMAAGLGLAFHEKPKVRKIVGTQINFSGLRAHLFAQGYTAGTFVTD